MEERTCIHGLVESERCQACDDMDHNQNLDKMSELIKALNLIAYHLGNIGSKL